MPITKQKWQKTLKEHKRLVIFIAPFAFSVYNKNGSASLCMRGNAMLKGIPL